ncbi:DUF4224 domain-containing protein [Lelliottia sp. SL45]|uniref:DUF4224 domain-containing protein n=1 Tax=Lelliottia sp. SL45 TaxID=2994665 RepID=UPI002275D631|nr:DUF4224 domain-containing protein [Lelliottia sp. SL45]MCY1699717.1 DUF4224 domain-containing protein [Lelliottia sp. SL45]
MYKLTLSPQEVEEITGYRRYTAQQNMLRCHGIPFEPASNNRPIVLRKHVAAAGALPRIDEFVSTEPDFGALENGKTTQRSKGQPAASARAAK